jgi:hypothetical protein
MSTKFRQRVRPVSPSSWMRCAGEGWRAPTDSEIKCRAFFRSVCSRCSRLERISTTNRALPRLRSGLANIDIRVSNRLPGRNSSRKRSPSHYSRPNCLTAAVMDFNFSMTAYIVCSLKSICCARISTSAACARGTTTTPSLSAAIMSPG